MSDPHDPEFRFEFVPRGVFPAPQEGELPGTYIRAPDLAEAYRKLPDERGGHWRHDSRRVPWKGPAFNR